VIDGGADRVLHRRGVGGVHGDGQRVGQLAGHPAGAVGVDVGDHHPRALAGQSDGRRLAQSGRAAGHEDHLAREPLTHDCHPC
jgi:hypothetical protein